ncbi:dephospho-CoA kinase [Neptunitalea lumnitzerae]|uniref:Dephospho-CoA kinase n=1 Tax=Neptunitalea lumnitzerae TaxID=2965509 RepID=A0ABQ5MJY9_9FLAO|nr:dephospho-CoA kinase [Neptunitalea sp. Y10]GLB49725.1 dephospho-CoA kinase [Neptunitalea sp. Y10]
MIVGITGGIGSGKTTVAKMFKDLGVPVYISDIEAKKLMDTSASIKHKLADLFGAEAVNNNIINRAFIAKKVFNNKELLNQLNAIVHPEVKKHFEQWYNQQTTPFVIKESAILFETGEYKKTDVIITVTAPLEVKINRVIERDNTTKEAVLERMKNQWTDEQKIPLSHYIIENTNLTSTLQQVKELHQLLYKKKNTL